MANPSAPSGAVIDAQATVDFYTQPPIDTPQIFNTIDYGQRPDQCRRRPAGGAVVADV